MSVLTSIRQFFTASIFFCAILVTYANISGNYDASNNLDSDLNTSTSEESRPEKSHSKKSHSEKFALHSISKPITVR